MQNTKENILNTLGKRLNLWYNETMAQITIR